MSFASRNSINTNGDWIGCARALIASGAPVPDASYAFSDDVEDYFAELRAAD